MSALRIMVLGATGFIGPAVLRRLTERGHHAIAVSRRGGAGGVPGTETLAADRTALEPFTATLEATRPDAVIDLLAYTAADTLPLVGRMAGRVGRYVMASSGDVYRQYDLLHRRTEGVPQTRLSERAPLRTRPFPYRGDRPRPADDPNAWMDDYDKLPIERGLAAARDLSWSILRLPMVYGPADRNRRFGWAIGPMTRGVASLPLDARWAAWRTSLGHVDDVADALVLAAVDPRAHAQTFNVGPAEVRSNLEWARLLAGVCGWRGEVEIVPRDRTPEPARSRLAALDLTVPIRIDASRIRRRLGYTEVVALEDALAATVAAETAARA